MEIVTSLITILEECLLGFNHSNSVVKIIFFLKKTNYLHANYLSQQHAKLFENSSDFNNSFYSMSEFCIENHEVLGTLT